ncbi:hypothetical protein [Enhygromyxa salina]|uniref:Cytochrome c domain-containing protein n=1 Tax=Enhygromyxa salina TaxID=215803 RepID=A0A2S9Y7W0_9BACT|nr:hypothetical protein [Enhygromyxa salina]PRQ01208.1 hypothetical protein ENSA7_58130 [Enhygromyxa salina]
MRIRNLSSSLTISLCLLLTAGLGLTNLSGCDKSKPATDDPSTTSGGAADSGGDDAAAAAPAEEAPATWADMDRGERMTFMGTKVLPEMKESFKGQGFDTFKCANCHGEDYKEVDFKIPNDLTPLNPDNPIQSGMDLDEEMTKFMVSSVLPQMAELLGKETDVTTGKGEFGCLSCHLSE